MSSQRVPLSSGPPQSTSERFLSSGSRSASDRAEECPQSQWSRCSRNRSCGTRGPQDCAGRSGRATGRLDSGRGAPEKLPSRPRRAPLGCSDGLLGNPVRSERLPPDIRQILDIRKRGTHVDETVYVASLAQSETASSSIRARVSSRPRLSPPVVTTSTGHPSSSSRSPFRAACLSKLVRSPMSTSRSTSLAGPASPRATEPKTRTDRAPWRAAVWVISSRRRRSVSILGAGPVGRG